MQYNEYTIVCNQRMPAPLPLLLYASTASLHEVIRRAAPRSHSFRLMIEALPS
jgi:hypothetical protein